MYPIIPVTQEVEMEGLWFKANLRQKEVSETLSQNIRLGWVWWFKSLILATWEAEIGRIMV
jgi:hypothetical protein